MNSYERESRAAVIAARLAYLFERQPAVRQARVYLTAAAGHLMVRPDSADPLVPGSSLIGTYTRSVTIEQLVEDAQAVEWTAR